MDTPYHLNFKRVDNSSAEKLYALLKERDHVISHKKMPSYEEHKKFINSNPYLHWYIFSYEETILGSFYIKIDNSIGINMNNPNKNIVEKVINFIYDNFTPQKEIPSKTPDYFYINVADTNDKMKKIIKTLGFFAIQVSFRFKN